MAMILPVTTGLHQGFMYQIPRIIPRSICLYTIGLEPDGKPTLLQEA